MSETTTETELNIIGLTPYTDYSVYVEAVTVEVGDQSDTVTVVTLEDGEEGVGGRWRGR